ncbi:kinase-like protein [Fomitiporia mediterranea MF3/22]|uniref:kinase-like protein n=1 Tax=Fomitiporia mediterranea (strain MF3/22) TaxID=694068 RepID=UPI0004407F5E|nr:kinase-like protein [Fomitiporia mediterranea MF3/22]EJD04585.1 kinase-like protein [Fomitiporia mediterranea MF3/22]
MAYRSNKDRGKKPAKVKRKSVHVTSSGHEHRHESSATQGQRNDKTSQQAKQGSGKKRLEIVRRPGSSIVAVRKGTTEGIKKESSNLPRTSASDKRKRKDKPVHKSQLYALSSPPPIYTLDSPQSSQVQDSVSNSSRASLNVDSSPQTPTYHTSERQSQASDSATEVPCVASESEDYQETSAYNTSGLNGTTAYIEQDLGSSNTHNSAQYSSPEDYNASTQPYYDHSYGYPQESMGYYQNISGYNQVSNFGQFESNNNNRVHWFTAEDSTQCRNDSCSTEVPNIQPSSKLFNGYNYQNVEANQNANINYNHTYTEVKSDDPPVYSYEWGRLLGTGSFGEVYEVICKDTRSSQKYYLAVKMFKNKKSRVVAKEIKTFELLKTLNHKNIIKYYGEYEIGGVSCFSFELMKDGDLFDATLKRWNGHNYHPWSKYNIVLITRQILKGLNYLLNLDPSLVHCDLKPENVLLSGKRVKITDFGFIL